MRCSMNYRNVTRADTNSKHCSHAQRSVFWGRPGVSLFVSDTDEDECRR